jgi:hypothetical protein
MRPRAIAIVIAVFAAAFIAPAAAHHVVRFARNADKVDGRHAVGAGASQEERAGRLVATNSTGRLPNNIIRRAPNAGLLAGEFSVHYEDSVCEVGTPAWAFVSSDGSARGVSRYQHHAIFAPCELRGVTVQRIDTGYYQVNFDGLFCQTADVPQLTTVVTIKSATAVPLIANTWSVCPDGHGEIEEEVRIVDPNGEPQDAAFVIELVAPRLPFSHPSPIP